MHEHSADEGVREIEWRFDKLEVDETDEHCHVVTKTGGGKTFESTAPTLEASVQDLLGQVAAAVRVDRAAEEDGWVQGLYLVLQGRTLSLFCFPRTQEEFLNHMGSRYVNLGPSTGGFPVGRLGRLAEVPKELLSFFDGNDD